MKKNTLSLQLPIALLSKSKVTMRALLEREVAQQECYIKETLKAIEIPFKGSLHPKIDRRQTIFSIKMKPYFSDEDFALFLARESRVGSQGNGDGVAHTCALDEDGCGGKLRVDTTKVSDHL